MFVAVIAIAGCSSSNDNSGADAAGSGSGSAMPDAPMGSNTDCVAPGYGSQVLGTDVAQVSATLEDPSSAPIAGLAASVTSLNLDSISGTTGSNGSVVINANDMAFADPEFTFGDGLAYAKFAVPIANETTALGTVFDVALPGSGSGSAMVAGDGATSGGVTLLFDPSADITVDTLDYPTADSQAFRAAELPIADAAMLVAGAPNAIGEVFGVAPLGTIICPPAKVIVPNTAGYAANASVGFYSLGLDVTQRWEPFGAWQRLSGGTVSADGTTITTTGGLPVLDNIGVALE